MRSCGQRLALSAQGVEARIREFTPASLRKMTALLPEPATANAKTHQRKAGTTAKRGVPAKLARPSAGQYSASVFCNSDVYSFSN
jgi:hypothetical protein